MPVCQPCADHSTPAALAAPSQAHPAPHPRTRPGCVSTVNASQGCWGLGMCFHKPLPFRKGSGFRTNCKAKPCERRRRHGRHIIGHHEVPTHNFASQTLTRCGQSRQGITGCNVLNVFCCQYTNRYQHVLLSSPVKYFTSGVGCLSFHLVLQHNTAERFHDLLGKFREFSMVFKRAE